MSTSSKNAARKSDKTEAPALAIVDTTAEADVDPVPAQFADFDQLLAQHTADEEGFEVELKNKNGEPMFNPDGSRSVARLMGDTAEPVQKQKSRNTREFFSKQSRPTDDSGKPRDLTEEETYERWNTALAKKYAAALISIDLWTKAGGGEPQRIELTPTNRRRIFEIAPHFVDDFWAAEVAFAATFRERPAVPGGTSDVGRGDGVSGDAGSDGPGQPGAPPDHEAGRG